jgi:hypothetical protein
MNIQAANKIAAELANVEDAYECLSNDCDGLPTPEQEAKLEALIAREKELREALREARSTPAKGWTAKLAALNID